MAEGTLPTETHLLADGRGGPPPVATTPGSSGAAGTIGSGRASLRHRAMSLHPPDIVTSWHSGAGAWSAEPENVGTKAAGLLGLPPAWVPRFVVFRTRQLPPAGPLAGLLSDQTGSRSSLSDLIEQLSGDAKHLLVRSNGPEEAGRPAEMPTRVIGTSGQAAQREIVRIAAEHPGREMLPLLQRAVEPAVVGQMSNERRFARSASRWIVEGMLSLKGPEVLIIRPGKTAEDALYARSRDELLRSLRSVAALLTRRPERYRCEWVWDGRRLWVVQADAALPVDDAAARVYLTAKPPQARSTIVRGGIHESHRLFDSPKLTTWRAFAELGWPRPDVRAITGDEWAIYGSKSAEVRRLESTMRDNPVVVRTDVRGGGNDGTLLPTSGPLSSVKALGRFMHRVASQFNELGITDGDYVFLLAPLVPTRASAMVRARPDSEAVDVDALWGFPDGLLLLPHDSYVVTRAREKAIVRHKPACLLWSSGAWRITAVGGDFDWRRVLARGELRQLASWGRDLARHEGREIQLLALARIGGARGPAACLPFHYTTFDTDRASSDDRTAVIRRQRARVVRSPKDLEELRGSPSVSPLLLRPDVRYLRDVRFLRAVGSTAVASGLPILFEGSLIGHAYYVLTTTGATVIPAERAEPSAPQDTTAVIVSPMSGIERVRSFERQGLRELVAEALAESEPDGGADPDPATDGRYGRGSPLYDVLTQLDHPISSSSVRVSDSFRNLPRLEGAVAHAVEALITDVPGDAPLFMDRL